MAKKRRTSTSAGKAQSRGKRWSTDRKVPAARHGAIVRLESRGKRW